MIYNSYQEQVLRNHSSVIENNFTVLNCLITVLEVNYTGGKKVWTIWKKSIQDRRKSICKCPEVRMSLTHLRVSKEGGAAGVK